MRNSRRLFIWRMASACIVSGAATWSSTTCHAVTLAYDDASDAAYNDNVWQGRTTNNQSGQVTSVGDNGGFGFTEWDFDTDWIFNVIDGIQSIDNGSSPDNQIGRAWRMATPVPQLIGHPPVLTGGLPRAGRGFAPLQVGQTIRVKFDNPTLREYYDGYFIRFNTRNGDTTAGGNICYDEPGYSWACSAKNEVPIGTEPQPKLTLQRFENFDNGPWGVSAANIDNDTTPPSPNDGWDYIGLSDYDTAAGGAVLELKITGIDQQTGIETFQLTVDPLGPGATSVRTGTLLTPGVPIDWIEFTFFNPNDAVADYSNNDRVDAADYVLWREDVTPLTNEVALPLGDTTLADYGAWRARFGNDITNINMFIRSIEIFDDTPGAAAGVPEPGAFVYLVAAGMGLISLRFRRSREAAKN